MHDISFREGMSVGEAELREISDREDQKKNYVTTYNSEDWRANEESNKSSEDVSLKAAVQIDGETVSRFMVMISEDEHHFPPPKRNGDEFILLDTCSEVSYFN